MKGLFLEDSGTVNLQQPHMQEIVLSLIMIRVPGSAVCSGMEEQRARHWATLSHSRPKDHSLTLWNRVCLMLHALFIGLSPQTIKISINRFGEIEYPMAKKSLF